MTDAKGRQTAFSVIIPAHNEASVIARCIATMMNGAPEGAMEIIVVCNGCRDDTAEITRRAAPHAVVIELAKGSKPLALNTGNAAASHPVRIFVDADIRVDYRALRAVADKLQDDQIMVAAPKLAIDDAASQPIVRAYYRTWQTQPYVTNAMVGSGVFGLSESGVRRVGTFPSVIADDEYVRTLFNDRERASVARAKDGGSVEFTMTAPKDWLSLVRIESRQRSGIEGLRQAVPGLPGEGRMTTPTSLFGSLGSLRDGFDLVAYLAIKAAGRAHYVVAKFRGRQNLWLRDESSRTG